MAPRRSTRLRPQIQASGEGARTAPRRSPRLHPQTQASEEGAGTARRRSTRLHPQIQAIEEGAGGTRRCSPRLHPQIHASEDRAGVTRRRRRRRGTSPATDASLPDDDDMLREILIRLPPQPSSLLRASAVCKRWLGLVTDPKFHRQFYAHHRKPPLLGFFEQRNQGIVFSPVLDPPDPIPPQRFNLGRCSGSHRYHLLNCRHGRVLVEYLDDDEVVVCNPITGEQRRAAIPPEFRGSFLSGVVLCAAADDSHVHGGCHSSPFKVVLVSAARSDHRTLAYVYSSETSAWGSLISIHAPCLLDYAAAPLIGNCVYWLSVGDGILEFDLSKNSLNVIMEPPVTNNIIIPYGNRQVIQFESGVVGFAILCYPDFHMWKRNVNDHGVATWTPWKTIEIHTILGLPPRVEGLVGHRPIIEGYDEDSDLIFLSLNGSVYMLHLKSIQSRKLYETVTTYRYHPFKSFYTPGDVKGCCS